MCVIVIVVVVVVVACIADGTDSQLELVRAAADLGLSALAITDHDQLTIDSDAVREAQKRHLKLLFGTEISAEWTFQYPELHPNGVTVAKVHVLGYYVADTAPNRVQSSRFKEGRQQLQRALKDVRTKRDDRNLLIVQYVHFDLSVYVAVDCDCCASPQSQAHVDWFRCTLCP
jgi:hypothetical protein